MWQTLSRGGTLPTTPTTLAHPTRQAPTATPAPSQQQQQQRITLLPSERWLYCGKTGTGKSYLARHNLRTLAAKGWRVVIVDPEGFWCGKRPRWERSGPGTVDKPRLVTARFDPRLAVQLYIPARPAYRDEGLMRLCLDAMTLGGVIVYFDEVYGTADHNRINEGVLEVWTQGRKHDVGGWVSVQRPARIPEYYLSQAENWAVFNVPGDADRKRLAAYSATPAIVDVRLPERYWWYWHQSTMDHAQLMQPLDTGEPATPGTSAVVRRTSS
ncbi:MAG TPA: hypothetical protein VF116_16245 [Ktedonobacterales bacterium]